MGDRTVLIIDDDREVAEFIARVAELSGFEPAIAEPHDRFDEWYLRCLPAIVVTDLQMPGLDGIEVLRFLAAQGSRAKVVLMSGFDTRVVATSQRLGLSLGLDVVGALSKPVAVADMRALLARVAASTRAIDEQELRAAIDAGELLLHYQPKVCLCGADAGRVIGVEALVRWQHPRRGLLQPAAFIGLAERSGAIVALTDAVMEAAIAQAARWRDAGLDLSVSLNVPPQALDSLDFPDRVAARAARAGVPAQTLVLEITETGAMEDTANVMDILTRLRLKGIDLSIDDFGTGYSSLVQLYRMPFSELKIDRSFVQGIGSNPEAEVIVRAVVDLAHNLSLSVCAEGIEDEYAWRVLADLGCERGQGYFMSRPLAAPALEEWIARWHASRQVTAREPRQDAR